MLTSNGATDKDLVYSCIIYFTVFYLYICGVILPAFILLCMYCAFIRMLYFVRKWRNKTDQSIILNEKDTIVNDPSPVAETFNEFFTTVASGIGFDDTIISAADAIRKHKEHSSVKLIRHEFGEINGEFDFRPVTVDLVMQNIKNVNPKEATGYDNIPGKMIKIAYRELSMSYAI